MIRISYRGHVMPDRNGDLRLLVENTSYPGQMFSGEDLDLLFKMFPESRMTIDVGVELPEKGDR